MNQKLSHTAVGSHIDKRRSLITTKRTRKEKSKGLTFPDNFLAIFGYRRKNA